MTFDELRREYDRGTLLEQDMADDPFEQFRRWFADATDADILLPDAMVLATVGRHGSPSARCVVLRGFDERGFVFYTNYESDKAEDLEENPCAVLHFFWAALERQVEISGEVTRTSREEAEAYWGKRPRESKIGAWASQQSQHLEGGRAELDASAKGIEERFLGKPVPCPENWGGYRLMPFMVEFWQGRASRLHDRLCYSREDDAGDWLLARIAP